MIERQLTLPTLALIAGTRLVLGIGLGLLVAHRLDPSQRRAVGWALCAVGAATTVPLAMEVLGNPAKSTDEAVMLGKAKCGNGRHSMIAS
jgi:hypothetical protein